MESFPAPPPHAYVPIRPLEAPAPPPAAPPPIPPARPLEMLALVAIVVLADVSLYWGTGGAGLGTLLTGIAALLFVAAEVRRFSWRLVAIGALFAAVVARTYWETGVGTTLLGPLLLVAFAITLRKRESYVPELVASYIGSAFGSFLQIWNFGASGAAVMRRARVERFPWTAVFVPIGLVAVFAGIFAAANPLVQRFLGSLFAGSSLSWFPSPVRFVFWAVCAVVAAGLLRPAVRDLPSLAERLSGGAAADEAAPPTLVAIARNGMIGLNALFLGYNALDAVYLWAGRAPAGVTHTDYAHAGAAWLTVALVLATIVLGSLYRGAMLVDPRAKLARVLAYVWAGQNFVLAAGTFRRITMYVTYSGLTELRILGIFGTALATVGLAIVVMRVARRRTMLWVLRRQLDAFALALAIFVASPTSWIAMRYNVARIGAGQYRPLLHLFQQRITPEAIPAMLPLLDHEDPMVRQGVAARLAELQTQSDMEATQTTRWAEYEVSRARARRALRDAAPKIDALVPAEKKAALGQLRGTAYGINEEVERPGDEVPFDFRSRRYSPRY